MGFRGNTPFLLVGELVGGAVVALLHRLRPWVEDLRSEQEHRQLWEWFQWLAERLADRGRSGQTPAHDKSRDWSPKR